MVTRVTRVVLTSVVVTFSDVSASLMKIQMILANILRKLEDILRRLTN